jgi:hypothetical protein
MYIYHNRSHNIHKPVSVDAVSGGYIYYYGNTVTMDSSAWARHICSGFWKVYGGEDSLTYPMYAFNNSFFGYGNAFNAMEARATQFKHFNNAYFFAGTQGWVLKYVDATNAFDYDMSNKPWPGSITAHHLEQHGRIGNVGFMDQTAGDLRLSKGSPAIDAGKVMTFKELGWTQTYQGKAPDIGAYEGDELVDGPAFRFRVPENARFSYKETPRIVKYRIDKNKLILYFSAAIDPVTLTPASIRIQKDGADLSTERISFPNNPFELVIETNSTLKIQNTLSTNSALNASSTPAAQNIALSFKSLPKGINGQPLTYWASAIPIIKP